ncbi:hypothetical protein [Niabella hirudinis]|uniref:hypothetical protein n=1 Tax=Niabella hirudinis TaxID=1285929 RepID=UPI003EBF8DFE
MPEKLCLSCQKPIRGRTDKKFCDDFCRNHYNNNSLRGGPEKLIRNINIALRKNRKILRDQLRPAEQTATVHRNKLLTAGFRFNYMTHQYRTKKAQTYCFCYDYGYLPLANNWLLVVRKKGDA